MLAESESSISRLLQLLSEEVLSSIEFMTVTLLTSKASGRSNPAAPWNMATISVTLLVSKATGWLNWLACLNMAGVILTLLVSSST